MHKYINLNIEIQIQKYKYEKLHIHKYTKQSSVCQMWKRDVARLLVRHTVLLRQA